MANPTPRQFDCIGPTTKALSGTVGISTVINAAERTKGRHCCKVLVDLNKHGVSPFVFVFVMTPNFALRTVSATLTVIPVQYIRFCEYSSVNLPCSTLLDAMQHTYCRARRVLALSSPLPAYLGSRRNAEPLAMWGSEITGGPYDRKRFTHPSSAPVSRICALGRYCGTQHSRR